MNEMFAVVDATTKGQLDKLTFHRMPGALPFAGKFRLIDFALSNMKHANITNVAIFPYGNYRSLQDHVGSGKRWDLDRRKDGLFVLPPKHFGIPTDDMITFQRMNEHIEYFRRSTQEYVLLTQANIVWNIDFNGVLKEHIESKADITEIMLDKKRLKTFIISKQLLLEYISEYDLIPYKTLNDIVNDAPGVDVKRYYHKSYCRTINTIYDYYRANIDMLRFDFGRNVFKEERPILSKEKTAPPATYETHAHMENSMVSSGSMINGTVINSVIGRDVTIKKDAVVENSIIMSNSVIENNAHINYAILDKATIVKKATYIEGTSRDPFVSQKEQVITNHNDFSVLHVASECYPFIKTGGLADVVNGLTRNLAKNGLEVSLVLPLYQNVKKNYESVYKKLFSKVINYNQEPHKIRVYSLVYKQVNVYFIEHFKYFERDKTYGYDDDGDRFAFFNLAVTSILDEIGPFSILHLHDWHTGLIPLILNDQNAENLTVLTLHNINYQGIAEANIIRKLDLKDFIITHDKINFLELGIQNATKLTTVSPTYRDELKYDYYGKNLTPELLKRERDFYGILNGLSRKDSPQNDSLIMTKYDSKTLSTKTDNKLFLQKEMQLEMGLEQFVLGMVSRIAEHKGFEILIPALDDFFTHTTDTQMVLLGTGDPIIMDQLKQLEAKFPSRIKLNLGYDSTIPNYIYAGADLFLMPSRIEPCGLSQMIAMRYGTLPLVRKTGGLADTVIGFDPVTKSGNGFSFYNYDPNAVKQALYEAYHLFKDDRQTWRKMMRRGMQGDFGLKKQATKFVELYQLMIQN